MTPAEHREGERLWFWRTSDSAGWVRSFYDPGPSDRPDFECVEVVPADDKRALVEALERIWRGAEDATEMVKIARAALDSVEQSEDG